MAKYRQKWRGIQKNKSHRNEHHRLKKTVEMIWESNQSRQFNTCKEGYCPLPETPWQTSINLTEYDKIRSQKNKIAVDIQTWEVIIKDF